MDNREHVEQWERTEPHTWIEEYQDYRYWSNGRIVSAILATERVLVKWWKKT